jgi:hypothetical protein
MSVKPTIWYPIAVALTVVNLLGIGYAMRPPEPLHAATHVALALVCGMWARRLRQRRDAGEIGEIGTGDERLEALGAEMDQLRQQLSETQERLDFAERLLAQQPETRRAGPPR